MSISIIPYLVILAFAAGLFRKGRGLILQAISTFFVFWFQPRFDVPAITFLVPLATIAITIVSWVITSTPTTRSFKQNWAALLVIFGVTLLVWANKFFKIDALFETVTPDILLFILAWFLIFAVLMTVLLLIRWQKFWLVMAAISLIFAFILVKSPTIAGYFHLYISKLMGRAAKYSPFVFQWFGYSYIAFRLLHTYFDRRSGKMPEVTLVEYVNYVFFFPALPSGPIDRIERFITDLRNPRKVDNEGLWFSGKRILLGLFKKFVIADALALVSIDKFDQFVKYPVWLWILLYMYAFRIYFDFSGYTDIALGIGRLAGIQLPENFDHPYLKPNITQFWNSWHMTLTQWFRGYFFNPLVRKFRQSKHRIADWIIIMVLQLGTMVLIGLWHGITINFVLWGAWHALGLFFHNRWSVLTKKWQNKISQKKSLTIGNKVLGIIITFNFVALGWLFFVLPTPAETFRILARMFGIGI